MRAFHLSRQGTPPIRPQVGTSISAGEVPAPASPGGFGVSPMGGMPGGLRLPPNMRPQAHNFVSAPAVPKMPAKVGLSARRNMKLPGGLPGADNNSTPKLNANGEAGQNGSAQSGNMFSKFSQYVDTKNGTLKFAGKAVIHGQGIDFTSGSNFSISLDEVDTLEELGKGNYGTVYKVRHARPRMRRPGLGLAGHKFSSASPITPSPDKEDALESSPKTANSTGVVMAMKEIRLELEDAKFAAIIMELDILHRCLSPYIIDFYGAFFQEGAVYICIEFMDGGSIDKIYGDGIPENVLRKITYATTQGLKTLKDDHNIIHRDVKPTNILVNTRGQVKICDFGVSGNLVASIAKTNIGCQSYMAPERISGGGMAQAGAAGGTYSVQSDIWSLGLSIIECAMGRYPYPPETYNNIFSQLSVSIGCHVSKRQVLTFNRQSSMANLRIYQTKATLHLRVTLSVAVSTKSPSFARPTECSCNMAGSRNYPNHTPFRKKTKTLSLRIRREAILARAVLKTKKLPTGSRMPLSARSLVSWARQRSQLYMLHL